MSKNTKAQDLYKVATNTKAKQVLCIKDYNGTCGTLEKGKKYPICKAIYDDELLVTSTDDDGQDYVVSSLFELLLDEYVKVVA